MFRLLFSPALLVLAAIAGCDARVERFEPNAVYELTLARSLDVPTETLRDDVSATLDELFGTPDQPQWPASILESSSATNLVQLDRLIRASGPFSSEKDGTHIGLFREHCVVCHGLEGSGAGPASMVQNPYPRDFRHGIYKWKSTRRDAKPTREDLRQLLQRGVPGTAMPSFASLSEDDQESLIDYAIYLSIRGEVERRLMTEAINRLDYGITPPDEQSQLRAGGVSDGSQLVADVLNRVVNDWAEADQRVVATPDVDTLSGEALAASVARGKDLFHGPIANCVGCHGPAGNGAALTLDYDDWAKEYSTRLGLTPDDREALRPFRDRGALRPRPVQPRDLQSGVFRGGGDSHTLYRRIAEGIAGTPMPGVEVVEQPDGRGLTSVQIIDLVRYVQSLSTDDSMIAVETNNESGGSE